MKKTVFVILLVLLCLGLVFLLLRGVQALLLRLIVKEFVPQDWSVCLPNGYKILRINSQDTILVKAASDNGYDTVVSAYINAYWYNERYIGLWCAKGGAEDLLGVAPEQDHYYLIDAQENSVRGPLTPTEYDALSGFDSWTKTRPAPEEAAYP